MTMSKKPIVNLLRSVSDVINSYLDRSPEQQVRAVNIGAIWTNVQNRLNEEGNGYVLDIYADDAGVFAIITRGDGQLYKIPVTLNADSQVSLGEEQLVVMDFKPVTARSLTVKRQADGQLRWFAMPACTAVLNRSGEIDSRALFDSFVEHIERDGGAYPQLDFFHLGERLVLGQADWVARDGYSYCASGLFDDTEIGRAAAQAIEAEPDYWGLSIAYLPTEEPEKLRSEEGVEIPVYNAGINRYISLLPEDTAASILTSISTGEEVNRMDKKVMEALRKLTGDDEKLLEAIVATVDDVNRSATGMINREQKPAPVSAAPKAPAAKTPAATPARERELSDADIDAVLASDKFATRFGELFGQEMEARAQNPDEEENEAETEEQEPAEAEAQGELRTMLSEISTSIQSLNTRVDELSKTREAEVQEVLNDLPARIAKTPIVRPRATRMPGEVNSRQARTNMAEVAAQTLAAMGEAG